MIIWKRTANIHDGKAMEAFAWAVKVASWANQKYPGTKMQVIRNVGGPLYQVHWTATYDSLASWEKAWKQIEADDEYRALLAEVRQQGALVGVSVVDSLSEVIA